MGPKCYLVGAGPGDPGLLTVRARDLLTRASTVLYDHLADDRLLDLCPPPCRIIYVGKASGAHSRSQEEINTLLLEEMERLSGRAEAVLVRLKGGDPFVFGRGHEEALALTAAGLGYEVVPGVSALGAATAYAGIPLTARGHAASLAAATGHYRAGEEDRPLPAPRADTLVYFMGVGNLPAVIDAVLSAGYSRDTPAAVIERGARPDQRVTVSTLGRLNGDFDMSSYTPPGLIVIGEVVGLRQRLAWFERLPLFGCRIRLVRPRQERDWLAERLEADGALVHRCYISRFEPLHDKEDALCCSLRTAPSVIVLTSPRAVDRLGEALTAAGEDSRRLSGHTLLVIGPGTGDRLGHLGLRADALVEPHSQEGVVAWFKRERPGVTAVLVPRAETARELLERELSALGYEVTVFPLYRTVPIDPPPEVTAEVDLTVFTSAGSVRYYARQYPLPAERSTACMGEATREALRHAGVGDPVTPTRSTFSRLHRTLREWWRENGGQERT